MSDLTLYIAGFHLLEKPDLSSCQAVSATQIYKHDWLIGVFPSNTYLFRKLIRQGPSNMLPMEDLKSLYKDIQHSEVPSLFSHTLDKNGIFIEQSEGEYFSIPDDDPIEIPEVPLPTKPVPSHIVSIPSKIGPIDCSFLKRVDGVDLFVWEENDIVIADTEPIKVVGWLDRKSREVMPDLPAHLLKRAGDI